MHAKSIAPPVLALLLVVAAAGCGGGGGGGTAGGGEAPHGQPPAEGAATSASAAATSGTAAIHGKVTLAGEAPKGAQIKMDADPYCKMHHGSNIPSAQTVVANPDGTLRNVFVYVKEGLANKKYTPPAEPVVLDQEGCTYHPHVFGIMVGQTLEIRNSDATLHNIHSLAKNSSQFNFGMPTKGMQINQKFKADEVMVRIKCDVHPWMEGWAGVLSHPFYSVTGDGGAFALDGLPAGTYTVEAWHEKYGAQTKSVTVKDGETTEVSFTFQVSA